MPEDCPLYANNNQLVPCTVVNGTCYCVASQKLDDGLFVNLFHIFLEIVSIYYLRFLLTMQLRWDDADSFCRAANMSLVSLETADKDREVINTINILWSPSYSDGYFPYWTSGRFNADTLTWEWTATGQPVTYKPPFCCNGPSQPCNCPTILNPKNGECIVNHGYNGFWYWTTANETEALHPFTCEARSF